MSISHEEFQFDALMRGYDIADEHNIYKHFEFEQYIQKFFNDNQVHPVPNEMIIAEYFFPPKYFISFPKEKLVVLGNFDIRKNKAKVLPNDLQVHGILRASGAEFEQFPPNLDVLHGIFLHQHQLHMIPDGLVHIATINSNEMIIFPKVSKEISMTPIISHEEFQFNALMRGFELCTTKDVYNAQVLNDYLEKFFDDNLRYPMPENWYVQGNLYIPQNCISLPKKSINVQGNLFMGHSNTQVLPNELTVTDSFVAYNTKFKELPQQCNIGNSLILFDSNIHVLPCNINVKGDVDIRNCKNVYVLPLNLNVKGTLAISGTNIKEIPNCTKAYKIIKDF